MMYLPKYLDRVGPGIGTGPQREIDELTCIARRVHHEVGRPTSRPTKGLFLRVTRP